MELKWIIIVLFIFSLVSCIKKDVSNKSVDSYEECRLNILDKNVVSNVTTFVFKNQDTEIDKLELTYLGNIITIKEDTLRIINSINYFGLTANNLRASSRIYIYNTTKKLLGYYNVGSIDCLPKEILNNQLYFYYNNEECNVSTFVSLKDSIPNQLFIECKNQLGDLYQFEK